jgi:hypothetical protein
MDKIAHRQKDVDVIVRMNSPQMKHIGSKSPELADT